MKLRDPKRCPKCRRATRSRVIDSRSRKGGYRRRLHLCGECGETWPTYESLVDPKSIVRALPEWARESYLE